VGEYALAVRAIDDLWQRNHVYCRDVDLFNWTFNTNPNWVLKDSFSFAIAEYERKIVGILGIIPFLLNNRGAKQPGCWLVNWIVDGTYRKTGAGLSLFRWFKDFTPVSFGINDTIARLYAAMKWSIVENIPRLLFIPAHNLARLGHLCDLCGANVSAENLSKATSKMTFTGRDIGAGNLSLNDVHGDWDNKGWRFFESVTRGCERNFSYLNWRYQLHPTFDYKSMVLPDGEKLGLVVWRVETLRKRVAGEFVPVDKLIRVVEFLPASPANAKSLAGAVFRSIEKEDAIGADFYSFNSEINDLLVAEGFVDVAMLEFGNELPSRFQPIDNNGGRIKSGLRVDFDTPQTGQRSDWYWTRSDSDQDRPN